MVVASSNSRLRCSVAPSLAAAAAATDHPTSVYDDGFDGAPPPPPPPPGPDPKLAFVASDSARAQDALKALRGHYADIEVDRDEADVLVALGGDGYMLRVLQESISKVQPIFGVNCGTVGFMMNEFRVHGLLERVRNAQAIALHPLKMTCLLASGERCSARAINEVSVFRETRQAAKLCIHIDGRPRLDELVCDGIILATPAGSTAYNLSASGPVLPLDCGLLALTPISPFRPRRWRGALLPDHMSVGLTVLETDKRPVSVVADDNEFRNVVRVDITLDHDLQLHLLCDHDHTLDERIFNEQFVL